MNADIKEFISSYSNMIDMYIPKVAPDSAALADIKKFMNELSALGEKCGDIMQFMTEVGSRDMMNLFSKKLTILAEESLKQQNSAGAQRKEPSASDLALGYHYSYDSIKDKKNSPRTCAVYERIFTLEKESGSAIELLRKMGDEGLFIKLSTEPLIEMTEPLVRQAEDISLPVMAFHNEKVIEAAGSAKNSIQLEYETQRLYELNRIELMCDQMMCNDIVYLLGGAISGYLLSPTEENRQRVENCYLFVVEFFGLTADELYAIPRVKDVSEKIIIASVNKGEGGRKYTLESFITEQLETIKICLKDKRPEPGPASRKSAVLWGKNYPLNEMQDVFRHPDRPC